MDFKEMTVEEADQLQRDIQLGDDDYVLPNGETKKEFAERQRLDARAATVSAPSVNEQPAVKVRVAMSEEGHLITSPITPDVAEAASTGAADNRDFVAQSSQGDKSEIAADGATLPPVTKKVRVPAAPASDEPTV
jgi:hypothetical protein